MIDVPSAMNSEPTVVDLSCSDTDISDGGTDLDGRIIKLESATDEGKLID